MSVNELLFLWGYGLQSAGMLIYCIIDVIRAKRWDARFGSYSTEYCMCGERVDSHTIASNHAPLSEFDYRYKGLVEYPYKRGGFHLPLLYRSASI
ncbi:MAG: hypothetical protein Unbinned4162contig1001_30 [Prokaryotic dsDNA virus sp.]|mgnify:CR=1 FL=1|nr:MAG: hypothetical protein Unbinned4162contig1001_30 [Prokaryotic dsDNA virus sp.]|tara:strand:+ start:32180 stop:32464 length:285 start_codon:yes stop_codon:yes gene_type:complete